MKQFLPAMYSAQFLNSYHVFSAAATAYRSMFKGVQISLDAKTVTDAFTRATVGLSKAEQTELLLFVLQLIQLPEEFNWNSIHRDKIELSLDRKIAKQFPEIVNAKRIISESEFLARAGMTKEDLSRKLRERRIFSIPEWIHKDPGEEYYPAFFIDPQYDRNSVEAVSVALRAFRGERKYRFFTTPFMALGYKTPLEILASGEFERVVEAAKAFRRQTVKKSSGA
jgi:hypothetical protein